jgi:ABC-type glycerol-3-phosphate transport system permease component
MRYIILGLVVILFILPLFRLLTYISKRRNRLTASEIADIIEKHILGTEGPWDWDYFISIPIADDSLDRIRMLCIEFSNPTRISEEKTEELLQIVEQLRKWPE